MTDGRPRRRVHLVAAAGYAVLAVALTYPLVLHLHDRLAGDNVDLFLFPWSVWWLQRSAAAGASPFFTPLLYHPHGAHLVFHTLALPVTAWAALLPAGVSPGMAYNLLVLSAPAFTALAAYALAFQVTGSVGAAALAGVLYGFTPNHFDQARGHLDCAVGVFLPLGAWFSLRLLHAPTAAGRLASAAGAAGMLVLALMTRLEQALAGIYLIGLVLLLGPASTAMQGWAHRLRWGAAVAALTLLIGAPYFILAARHWPAPPPPNGYEVQQAATSIRLERYAVPPPRSLIWGWASPDDADLQPAQRPGQVAFLGYGLLLLFVWSAVVAHGQRAWRFWAAAGALFLALALGPSLHVGAVDTGMPLPFRALPLLELARAPNRFVPAAVLCLALAIAVAWARRTRTLRAPAAATAALAALLAADQAMLPFPTTAPRASPFYARLAAEPGAAGVVELPAHRRRHDKLYMYYQTLHGHPLSGGHVSRPLAPPPDIAKLLVRRRAAPAALDRELQRLARGHVRYLIFHLETGVLDLRGLDPPERELLEAVIRLRGRPAYRDETTVVIDLQPPP